MLCKGTPICPDMRDLKWCKNKINWNISDANSIPSPTPGPLLGHIKCILQKDSTNTKANNGQWIQKKNKGDGMVFHCLNRGDENPFSENKRKNATEEKSKETWMELVNMPCDDGKKYRRCLGNRPDQCVDSIGKF